jgi:hypothetical protein
MKPTHLALVLAGVATLNGCSEQDRRTLILSAAVQTCVANVDQRLQQLPIPPGVDSQALCTCFVQRTAEGKSLQELADIFRGNGPLPDTRTLTQCAMDEGRRSGVLIQDR